MKAKTGVFADLRLGVVGSILGGWISSLITSADLVTGFNLTSILVAFGGAIVVTAIYRFIKKR